MRIGKRNYFICLMCGKLFSCPTRECEIDFCYCDKCYLEDPNQRGCRTKEENNKTLELILKLKKGPS